MTDLQDRLRELLGYAEAGGAPAELLRSTAEELVELLLDDVAARRLRALAADRRMRDLVGRVGVVVAAQRLGVNRTTVWRRLKTAASA